jgi:hypothetical protein
MSDIEVKAHKCELKFTAAHVDRDLVDVRTKLPGLGRVPDTLELLDASCFCIGAMWAAITAEPSSMVSFPFR